MNETVPAQSQELQQIEAVTQVADAMSLSLLFSLGRQYLDVPFEEASFIQPKASPNEVVELPHFLRLEQVGLPLTNTFHQPFTALQTALSACHDPGRYTLLFVVMSDGLKNRIYLGVRGHGAAAQPYAFVNYLGHFLRGNWPGTRLERCDYQQEVLPHILHPMSRRLQHATALTGIPSLKPGDHPGYPQSLDRLLRGLRGRPFMYIIVAEPMAVREVDQIIYHCRNLAGQVHTFAKLTLSETHTEGKSLVRGETGSTQSTIARQSSETKGSSHQFGVSLNFDELLKGPDGKLLKWFFPPLKLLSAIRPSYSYTRQQSKTTGRTDSETIGSSWSKQR